MQKKKILNFDTTLRDPERIQNYLKILKNYENQILAYDTIIDFFITIISQKLYIPQALYKKYPEFRFKDILSRQEAELIMEEFPQKHGAGGWKAKNEGWGGRFYQSFSTSNQLGFIHTEKGEKIMFDPPVGVELPRDGFMFDNCCDTDLILFLSLSILG